MADTTAERPATSNDFMKQVSVEHHLPYDVWTKSLGIPVHEGYYCEDVRTVELGWWPERECNAAILKLRGCEGVTEARVTEIPAGKTLPPQKFAFDEIVYVAQGRGLTTILGPDDSYQKSFEWQPHSLFLLPRNSRFQLSNVQGTTAARLLHYNYYPSLLSITPDPDFFLHNEHNAPDLVAEQDGEFYSEAKVLMPQAGETVPFKGRGAGGHVVWIRYPSATITNHMSVFPAQSYKKAHRHGPGVVIIIPGGEGFSVMWEEGRDKVFIPWHEGSVFVPPNRWFHQHFNVGDSPGRYLAFHAPRFSSVNWERIEDRQRDQIEYPDEDPWIRQTFEAELAKRGLKSKMLEVAYKDRNFEWDYNE